MNQNSLHHFKLGDFPGEITIQKNSESLVQMLIDVLEDNLRMRLSQLAPKPLGLATGRTMEPIYRALVLRLKSWPTVELEKLLSDWSSFNLDEYVGLSSRDKHSFAAYMLRHLGEPLKLTSEKLRVPNGSSEDPKKEASAYVEELKDCGGVGIQLLGLGVNGHLGFNEPPCSPDASCRVVTLSASTRKQNAFSFQNDYQLVPTNAITLGIHEILSAEEIHLVVTGEAKALILYSLLSEPASEHLPASWLRQHKNLFLWADSAAASQLISKIQR